MVKLQLAFPEGFLEEEVRCGYTVTAKMKRVWAVQMDLLSEFDKVCKKHNLRYFADSGTLLGAVRHQGYIPWDDDIDLVMLREDYKKLLEVADGEFSHPYFFQTMYNDRKLFRAHAQLRNSETTGYMPNEENRPYNKGIFIDIFPLDQIPDEGPEFKRFVKEINFLWRTIEYGGYVKDAPHKLKGLLFRGATGLLYRFTDYKKLFARYEKLCGRYNGSSCGRISYIAYSRGKEKHMFRREWFDETVTLPFEFMTIPAPAGYDERLRKEYNDYMTIRNVPSTHGEMIFDPDVPYKKYIKRKKKAQKENKTI